jgi:hypothetical protein
MALRDFLNIVNGVSVVKTISTQDGLGGYATSTSSTIIPLAALWTNGQTNKWVSDKYAKDSSDSLVYEYGAYTFNDVSTLSSTQSMIEQVSYNNCLYKTVGFMNDIMNLHEIILQQLERIS